MRFGEKIRTARKELHLSRQELSDITGLSKRTIAYYELDGKLPRSRDTVNALAEALHTDPDCLTDDSAAFVMRAEETYGAQGAKQAQKLVSQIRSLYAGGTLKEEDMDAMMLAIQDAYWIARKKAAERDAGRAASHNEEIGKE